MNCINRNNSYLFNFKSNNDLIRFINILFDHCYNIEIKSESIKIIGYEMSNSN